MKIGLLGGTFNPPHNAHLELARASLKHLKLDKILFMPSGKPPHRKIEAGLNPFNRVLFTRIATGTVDPDILFDVLKAKKVFHNQSTLETFFMDYHTYYSQHKDTPWEVSDLEYMLALSNLAPTYTIDTVRLLFEAHPEWEMHLIIGGDQAATLDSWKEVHSLSRLVTFSVATRDDHNISHLDQEYPSVEKIPWKRMDISSSMIRDMLKAGRSIKHLIPSPIARLLEIDYYKMNFSL